ncbi:MAG TPA: flavin reductase family protein [Ktedonosporobacter sp.]|nr:flavin reductase family protein [Ktedonosporobacter sp.]
MSDTTLIDARVFRSTMGRFATGVTVVTVSQDDGEQHAITVNAFLSVSLDPPLVLVSINNRSRMNPHLRLGGHYGINVLAASQEEHSRHFGGRPIEGLEVNWLPSPDAGVPLLDGCVAHIVAQVVDIHPAGDHILYIGQVEYLRYWEQRPLLFFSGKYKQIEAHEPMNAWSISSEGW